jgi:integrase
LSPRPAGARLAAARGDSDPLADAVNVSGLVRLGWDPATLVLTPDPLHPLLGYVVCRCGIEADRAEGLCASCSKRVADLRDGRETFGNNSPTSEWNDELCLVCRVTGATRPAAVHGLCFTCDRVRRQRGQSVEQFVGGDLRFGPAIPRPSFGVCVVVACERVAAHGNGLCRPHDQAWHQVGKPDLAHFCVAAVPVRGHRNGRIVFRGLPERVILELLYGLQASLAKGRKVAPRDLRAVVDHLRRLGVDSTRVADRTGVGGAPLRFLVYTVDQVGLASSDLAGEAAKDVWDLRVWGRRGRLSFVGGGPLGHGRYATVLPITQGWLKEAAKAWALEKLASRAPGGIHKVIAAVGLWSKHLDRRPDSGEDPVALHHSDIDAFLARLSHLEHSGELSGKKRARTVNAVAQFLRECREFGLTDEGQVLAGIADDLVFRRGDSVRPVRDDDEAGRALPEMVLAQLLSTANLEALERISGPFVRAAVELQAGVGRRTAELCGLAFECLDHDSHTGVDSPARRTPVLVHDMPKADKVGCRLPIHGREEAIIVAQQARVRAAFPDTPTARLALFPRAQMNPDGTKSFGPGHLQRAMRMWVDALPRLDGPDHDANGEPIEFPREHVFPYVMRHGFAQRHADAGTPVDTLMELMGHDNVHTTLGYYRVTAKRKREAQDRLGSLQLDAVAKPMRPGLAALTDTEALREQIGQVAVPFGVCTEPTNVTAGGQSCPFRHRCLGCEHFRTDPSYQPELQGFLTKLLEDRERLASAVPELAEWARRGATPSEEEIDAVRRLISTNAKALTELSDADREAVDAAIATMRRDRANLSTSFPVELRGLVRQVGPTVFPAIERAVATRLAEDERG